MARHASPSPLRTTEALTGVLQSKGFEVRDFDLEEDNGAASSEWAGLGGLLRVHCWSTGEERLYSIGSGSTWLGSFLSDLGRGHFARAARHDVLARA